MSLTFIVPVRNDAANLRRCLTSLVRQDVKAHVIVADNGSTDDSAAVAQSFGAKVLSLPGLRVSALRNRAVEAAETTVIAFVDADHEIGPTWARTALALFRDPTVGGAGALCLPPADGTWVQQLVGTLRGRTVGQCDTNWLGAGNLVVRRLAFARLHGFDETLETCEDVDLCQRLRAAGYRLVADEALVNVHHGDPRTLRELFRAERWRGRDNLRVSFRVRPTLRDVPSLLFPVAGAVTLGVATIATGAVRAARMVTAGRLRVPDWPRAYAVGISYEAARAAAIIWPAAHRRR